MYTTHHFLYSQQARYRLRGEEIGVGWGAKKLILYIAIL
jgi:hypothetical protein